MKARTVNFERNQDPKASMDIGGVNLLDEYNKIMDEADNKWFTFYKSILKGKNVTGMFKKMLFLPDPPGYALPSEWQKQTIKITKDETKINWGITKKGSIEVQDTQGNDYLLSIRDKIYIK